jgi:hypothetical protein
LFNTSFHFIFGSCFISTYPLNYNLLQKTFYGLKYGDMTYWTYQIICKEKPIQFISSRVEVVEFWIMIYFCSWAIIKVGSYIFPYFVPLVMN